MEQRRARGERVLPMGFGEAGLPVHPLLRDELRAASGRNAYGPVAGLPELRAAAAGYWTRRGLRTDAEQVVVAPGSKALLFAMRMACGGDVILPRPSWVSYAAHDELLGSRVWHVDTPPGGGGVPDPERVARTLGLARAAGREIRQVIVTLPDNPTGTIARPEIVESLGRVARENNLTVVSDEIYREVAHPGQSVAFPALFAPERTVVTAGLSKSHALGGWRLGIARFPDSAHGRRLRAHVLGIASEVWSTAAVPVQRAAVLAYEEPQVLVEHVAASARLHARVAEAVAARWAAHGARVTAPQGGFYVYPDLDARRAHLSRKWSVTTGADLADLLLDRHGVVVLPGHVFGEAPEALRLRVATSLLYGTAPDQREAALAAEEPLTLPWIAAALRHLEEALDDVLGTAETE
ncbi:pyridoxal phosphate-dependent aminotransferase [Yinghuangia sp. ASG 101]|uniref:pyridoxal phosphate-dependent aminotransferase n=1 Tax=Yinghuangia sp. ASG 101 TaxID=2896848 RepID=UPI001E484D74|nr:pyridoxal phosphate-dependent aminotransferase [Yinghuangia sp. ASG 101]UGQ10837.1 pyridoxal phosphate-dependent aminotransferase [Yinghuangia sp. ASG 101]